MQVSYTPTWKEYEEGMHSDDPNKALKSADAFSIERKKETALSKRARDWEDDRKKEIFSNKPAWVKEQKKKETAELDKLTENIKNFGTLDANLKPSRGYVLIKIIKKEGKTSSGIFMPESDMDNNVAEVIAVGGPIYLDAKTIVEPEIKPKDTVLLKKFAGIDVDTKQGKCKLIQFSDVLGILE